MCQQALGAALCEDGYDSVDLLYGLTPAELQVYGFKPGHLRRLEAAKPPAGAHLPVQLQTEPEPELSGSSAGPGTEAWMHADSLLQNTWGAAHVYLYLLFPRVPT